MRNGNFGMGHRGFMMFPMAILTIILIIVLIYLLVRIFKHSGFKYCSAPKENSAFSDTTSKALETLNNRYANGEITDEEYTNKKEMILK